jgi:predicted component of type VI protein secretion system
MAEAEVMAAVATSAAVDTLAEVGISAAALALAAECVSAERISAGRASAADPRYRGLRRGQASAANAPLRATAT